MFRPFSGFSDFSDWLDEIDYEQWHAGFEQRMEMYRRVNEAKLRMERDIINGNNRSEPMDRETFERLWGEEGEDNA